MPHDDKSLRRAKRTYGLLLLLYPRTHRREFGPLMTQLFRDQYRDRCRDGGRWPLLRLWLRTLFDLLRSVPAEHLTEQINRIKTMRPEKLALLLFITAFVASLFTGSLAANHIGVAAGLVYISSFALLIRAVVEWIRPADQLVKSLVWGAVIAVLWALFLPMWAKLKLPINAALVTVPILLNAFVPLVKTVLRLFNQRTPRSPR